MSNLTNKSIMELNAILGSTATLEISSNFDPKTGLAIPVKDQIAKSILAVQNFKISESSTIATIKGNGLYAMEEGTVDRSFNITFDVKSNDIEVLAMARGLNIDAGGLIRRNNAMTVTIPESGNVPVVMESGESLVQLMSVIDSTNSTYMNRVESAPIAGQYSIDFDTNELVFATADKGKKVHINLTLETEKGRSITIGNEEIGGGRSGLRMTATFRGGFTEVFYNFNISSTDRDMSRDDYATVSFGGSLSLSPFNEGISTLTALR